MPSLPVLSLDGAAAGYGGQAVVTQVTWQVHAGECWWVVGPNGGGKSTLLGAIAGLHPLMAGSRQVTVPLAFVPQREQINWRYPARVREVVAMGVRSRAWWVPRSPPADRIDRYLEAVGVADLADRPAGSLSGGQQQRVLLARALASGARLFLLDEPARGLDPEQEGILADLLEQLQEDGAAVVVVSHDLGRVARSRGQFLALAGREVARGPAAGVLDPDVVQGLYGRVAG